MDDQNKGQTRYLKTELASSEALRFAKWNPAAAQALREVVAQLPVRPFFRDLSDTDTKENVEIVGHMDEVLARLGALVEQDHHDNAAEVNEFANYETIVTDANLRPDALHVVTRLWSKARSPGSIIYGARLQRIDEDRYAMWSDY